VSWAPEEDVQRDLEKAQECVELYGGHILKAPNRYEIRTGLITASRFADKLRRAAFAAFGGAVPKEEIVRAAAELNKKVYERLASMGVGKLDIVRISVEASVEGGRLIFGEPKAEWFVPHTEVEKRVKECEQKLAEIKRRLEEVLKG